MSREQMVIRLNRDNFATQIIILSITFSIRRSRPKCHILDLIVAAQRMQRTKQICMRYLALGLFGHIVPGMDPLHLKQNDTFCIFFD